MFKTKSKGITPVIATVLLITISVGATVSAFTFINNLQNQAKENWENRMDERTAESKASLDIETAFKDGGNIVIQIRNTGSIGLKLNHNSFKVYVEGKPKDSWSLSGSSPLAPQETAKINTGEPFPSNSKTIEVFGPYGTQDSYVCYNSGSATC